MDFAEYLEGLAGGSKQLSISGLQRLSGMDPEEVLVFASAWPHIDVRRRRRIVQELIDLEEDTVELNFDAVFFHGLEDDDPDVRLQSIRGLWEHEGHDLIAPLLRLLDSDEGAQVRAEAALRLGHCVLLFEEGRLRERYFREIEAGLRQTLDNRKEIAEVRARALEAMSPHDQPWVRQAIREAFESDIRRMRTSAIYAMGRSCESSWLPLILRQLDSEESEIRYEAVVACGYLAEEQAVPNLVPLLTDPDDEVRRATATALGEIGGTDARAALTDLANRAEPALKEAALEALTQLDFEDDPLSIRRRA